MDRVQQALAQNREWAAQKAQDPDYFKQLAAGQQPDFLYIGCADSRVPANTILGAEPGEIFVHRNVANLVVNTDLNVHAVIDYALSHLKVKHVVVCGHYGCGGVKAATQSADLGLLNPWLAEIRDVARMHKQELEAIADEDARYRRLIELNVQEQCLQVMKTAAWQTQQAERGGPSIHGWVFDLANGLITDLQLPMEQTMASMGKTFSLR